MTVNLAELYASSGTARLADLPAYEAPRGGTGPTR